MEAKSQHQGFQDPLSAALEDTERATTSSSLDKPSTVRESAARESLKLSMNRQAADGSEDTEKAADSVKNDVTDSSTTWSSEVLQTLTSLV